MRKFRLLAFCLVLALLFSCENERFLIDCSECKDQIPENAELIVKLEDTKYNSSKDVEVFEGNLEDNILFKTIKTGSNEIKIYVPVNRKYTLVGIYPDGDGQCIAVDSAYPRVAYDEDQCDNPCYFTYDKTVNLRLKYD
jgi:hypothetical protein